MPGRSPQGVGRPRGYEREKFLLLEDGQRSRKAQGKRLMKQNKEQIEKHWMEEADIIDDGMRVG